MKFDVTAKEERLSKGRLIYILILLRSFSLLFGAFIVLKLFARAGIASAVEWYVYAIAFLVVVGTQLLLHKYLLKEYHVSRKELCLQVACLVVLVALFVAFG